MVVIQSENSNYMNMNKNFILTAVAALAGILALTACQPADDRSPGEIVLERAQQRWDRVIERDFAQAYEFYTPGFREMTEVDGYRRDMQNVRIRYTGAEALSAECEEAVCEVHVRVSYRLPESAAPTGMSRIPGERRVEETWIRAHGSWWFSPPR